MIQQSPRASSDVQVQTRQLHTATPIFSPPELPVLPLERRRSPWARVAQPQSTPIRLDLSSLRSFEVVDDQYAASGVIFQNTIALHPSNPSFCQTPGQIVLMGAPKSGMLEARFTRPAKFVSITLTGSRRTVMTGFDVNGAIAGKAETTTGNLANSGSPYPHDLPLELHCQDGIQRIRIRSIGGQFTLSGVTFACER
jgi:hypothetical protein